MQTLHLARAHVVLRQGRVDDEAQKAGTHQVPEGHVDEAVDDGLVLPLGCC